MKAPLFTLAAILTASMIAHSESARFYLGTYTKGPSGGKGIYTATLDTETGKLSPIALATEAVNPSFVAVADNGKWAYAAMEDQTGEVGSFAIQPDGSLQALNKQPAGKAACHVSVDAGNRFVFVANYSSGDAAVYPIQPDGSLGAQTDYKKFTGSGPDKRRQGQAYAHSIQADAQGRYVYVCDLGSDKIWTFTLDAEKGTLTPTEPAAASVPPGGGPRHLAFHPNGRFVYVNNEMGLSVTAFSKDEKTGVLTPFQTVLTLAEGGNYKTLLTTAEIICHPKGKWLYVSNRGADSIAVYSIAEDGRLTFIQNAPAEVIMPRGMGLDPSGQWLVTAGQTDSKIAVLKVDQQTGKLSPTGEAAEVPSPVSVVFTPKP